jgi:hypothetical protein
VPGDYLAGPAKKGLGPAKNTDQRSFARSRLSAQSHARSVGWLEAWPRLVATQDLELMTQHQDLDLLGPASSEQEQEEREHPPNGKADERRKLVAGTIGLPW